MFKHISLLFFTALFLVGCSTSPSSTDQQAATEVPEPTPEPEPTPSASFELNVLQADLPSPRKEITTTLGGATIVINYGSPSAKGRDIWGALVSYNKVWRTGANEATTFTTNEDIKVAGELLAAGTYGLFTIPTGGDWTVIFNKTHDQWGAYEYKEADDALRIVATPTMVEDAVETMDFVVDNGQLVLQWEKLRLPIVIE